MVCLLTHRMKGSPSDNGPWNVFSKMKCLFEGVLPFVVLKTLGLYAIWFLD